ncbi:hypothetical protein ACPW7J_09700 [Ihubacter sp. rT4E-8]|uniref:hypothetical protein n=1 Tax=Ihubacter sp. rT4E-8 TaxID=3242369 RepID=UPI003CEB59CA
MKKKITSITLAIVMVLCSTIPGFAEYRLDRPVIEDVDVGKNSIKIDWNYISGADEYDIYRSTSKNGNYKYIDSNDKSWYRDYNVKKGKRYYYKVRAISFDEYDNSKLSKWRSGKVKKPAPKKTTSSNTNSQTVYITDTGTKYHRSWCGYLHSSKHAISLSKAKQWGYSPCSRCW